MDVQEARKYIESFHLIIGEPTPIKFVALSSGRKITISEMTDDEAIAIAFMLQDMEREVGIPKGATVQ